MGTLATFRFFLEHSKISGGTWRWHPSQQPQIIGRERAATLTFLSRYKYVPIISSLAENHKAEPLLFSLLSFHEEECHICAALQVSSSRFEIAILPHSTYPQLLGLLTLAYAIPFCNHVTRKTWQEESNQLCSESFEYRIQGRIEMIYLIYSRHSLKGECARA